MKTLQLLRDILFNFLYSLLSSHDLLFSCLSSSIVRSDSVSCAASETESDTKQMWQVRNGAENICAVTPSQCLEDSKKINSL